VFLFGSCSSFSISLTNDASLIVLAVDSNGVICISSSTDCCNEERTSSGKRLNVSQNSIARLSLSASSSETATRFMKNTCQLKMRVPSMPSSCSETLRSYDSNRSRTKFGLVEKTNCTKDACSDLLDDSQDPYAFDEDDFQPSKWDLLSGKRKISRTHNGRVTPKEVENGCQYKLVSQEESSNGGNGLHKSSNREHHDSQKSSYCNVPDEEHSSLLADCLLTAIKVFLWTILRNFFHVPFLLFFCQSKRRLLHMPFFCRCSQNLFLAGSNEFNKWQSYWLSTNCCLWRTGDYVFIDCRPLPFVQFIYIFLWWDARGQFKHSTRKSEWYSSYWSRVGFACCYIGPTCELGRKGRG